MLHLKTEEEKFQECLFKAGCCPLLMSFLLKLSLSLSDRQGCPEFLVPTFANAVLWGIPVEDWASSCPLLLRTSWPAATIHLCSPWPPVLSSDALSDMWSHSWDQGWTLKPVIPVTMGASSVLKPLSGALAPSVAVLTEDWQLQKISRVTPSHPSREKGKN